MTTKFFKYIFFIAFFLVVYTFPVKAFAGYDSGAIISDGEFFAKNTMTETEIQGFLEQKGSFLANITVPPARTPTYCIRYDYYGNCIKYLTKYEGTWIGPVGSEVNSEGWKISKVIYNVSQWYGINPQVLLTIIEKESSFVSRKDGSIASVSHDSYATFAWLLGYAYTENENDPAVDVCGTSTNYNSAGSCAGIAMQIDWAGGSLPNWAKNANNKVGNSFRCDFNGDGYINWEGGEWAGNYWTGISIRLCDGEWVDLKTGASGALYRYTPHTGLTGGYSGNLAFYRIYNAWFNYYKFISENTLRQTSDISFSTQGSPAMGEAQTATFKVKNTSADSITVDMGLADEVASAKQWESFPLKETLTFTPGEEKELSYTKTIKYAGSHRIWASFRFNGVWYDLLPNSTQTVKYGMWVHLPDIRGMVYSFTSMPPAVGQQFTTTLAIKNLESRPITIDELGIANYNETYNLWRSLDTNVQNILINAGETKTYTFTKTLDKEGTYNSWPTYRIAAAWFSVKNMDSNIVGYRYGAK
jgi:hypothetical protein